jgi:ferric-dicitrate binding protein FerR (iron transport regulator)
MSGPCSRFWEIDPFRDGRLGEKGAKSFERHLRACEACRTQMKRDERLRDLARALPDDEPTELSLRRTRTRLLRDAAIGLAPAPASRGLRVGLATLVGVAGVGVSVWVVLAQHPPAPLTAMPAVAATSVASSSEGPAISPKTEETLAGAVTASGVARWSQTRAEGVERVVLDDGALRLHVRPQVAGERFLVTLPDGELEVRGTTFDVSVDHGATRRVHVDEGVVDVRLGGRGTRRLGAGETWNGGAPPPSPSPSHTTGASPGPSAAAVDGAAAYVAAIGLLREGRNDEAASAFHAFSLSQPGAAQAEDASFLEAVALARAGRSDAAALAAAHHLATFPASFHRKDAEILIARGSGDAGLRP